MNIPKDASTDQSNCPNGYYRNTSGMVMQMPTKDQSLAVSALGAEEMASDPDALRKLAKSKLVEIISNNPATPGLVPAIKELLDRIDGKAKERIEATVNGSMVHYNMKEGSELILQGIKEKLAKRKQHLVLENVTTNGNAE